MASSVSTPNGLSTDLCATVFDLGTGAPLASPGVCVTSGADPSRWPTTTVTTLNTGCYVLELKATNRCGTTAVQKDIDVLHPNFSSSLTRF